MFAVHFMYTLASASFDLSAAGRAEDPGGPVCSVLQTIV
ncbi:hypothetical protein V462_19020 [Pantoea ananatis 15320]|nr:hypothetical protein L585_04760 [Pantoea ananatis BRT175]PKC30673.1 hypothetical protein V462_19020 [Pantoea ananatis 15320]PKC41969.1 hypothetical protein V461_16835 [Pantoea ananatis BRT98]CCF11250.1 hypothetical protein PANA5342_3857 [Pantoea ananatis LMG 5342]